MTTTITPEALERAMAAACKAGEYAELPSHVYDALIAGWHELLAAQPTTEGACTACGPAGVFASDGTGPYDCYACGKPASSVGGQDPAGYHYRYQHHDGSVIRKNNGQEVNGARPTEAIPYFYAAPIAGEAAQGITPDWVLGYFDTDLPERARDAVRYAFAEYAALASSLPAPAAVPVDGFQFGVSEWMRQCFVPAVCTDVTERGDRFLEEVLELLQSHGYDRGRVPTLVEYVYGRPIGEPAQEVGGVMVTLAAYCHTAGIDMHAEGARELTRITQPEVMAKIRSKQAAKSALPFDTPLPGDATQPAAQGVDLEDTLMKAADFARVGWGAARVVEWLTEQLIGSQHQQKESGA